MSVVKQKVAHRNAKLKVGSLPKASVVEGDLYDKMVTANSVNAAGVALKIKAEEEPEYREWNPSKRWNPFNSYKLLAHIERWKKIKRGRFIPPPVLITVDPTNICNLNCVWCNAKFVRTVRRGSRSEKALCNIAEFLPHWGEGAGGWQPGVQAVCVAGGGEPLLNPATGTFIDRLVANGIEVGVVTNGTQIHGFVDSLSQAVWVGVSVDAATKETLEKLKGGSGANTFDRVIENIAILANYSKSHNNKLGWSHPAYGVSYKYLLYKDNISEIYEATKLAKEIGCKNIHFRPAGTTWDKLGTEQEITFSQDDISLFREQITRALELDDETFSVYGVTHKFNSQFASANYFCKCHSIFMTAVIEPPTGKDAAKDAFTIGLCCDRRGDSKLQLARSIEDVQKIQKLWGSEKHWDIHDSIVVRNECPRCTYQPHNEIYEQVILRDSMTYKFI